MFQVLKFINIVKYLAWIVVYGNKTTSGIVLDIRVLVMMNLRA